MERTRTRNGYQNIILSCIAGLLALGMVERHAGSGDVLGTSALAQSGQPDAGGIISTAEQRKQIIAELRTMNSRLERIESKLNSGLSVKVTDMPKDKSEKPKADKGERPEGKPEAKVEVTPAPEGK